MKFARIGEHALDLDDCSFEFLNSHNANGITVFGDHEHIVTIWSNEQPLVYADLEEYVLSLPTLAAINAERENARRLATINRAYDPFADISSLFSLFNELPNREELRLVLDDFENGRIERKEDGGMVVMWNDFMMGLDAIERYSQKSMGPVEQ